MGASTKQRPWTPQTAAITHGRSGSPTYSTWSSMIQRCTNENHPDHHYYGGRGIGVCERWRDFENFLADMGERPEARTLDRIDNNRGYEPGNCRWATRVEQAANRNDRIAQHARQSEIIRRLNSGESRQSIAESLGIRKRLVDLTLWRWRHGLLTAGVKP